MIIGQYLHIEELKGDDIAGERLNIVNTHALGIGSYLCALLPTLCACVWRYNSQASSTFRVWRATLLRS